MIARYIWILFFVFAALGVTSKLNAQQLLPVDEKSYIDSLQVILKSKKSDSIKARTCFLLSYSLRSRDTVNSRVYLIKGKSLGNRFPLLHAFYFFYEGQFYFNRNAELASIAFMRADKELSVFQNKDAYKFRSAAIFNYAMMKRTEKGDDFMIDLVVNKVIPLSERAGEKENTAHYYSQLGMLLMFNAQFDKAQIYIDKAINLLEGKLPNSPILLSVYLSATSNYCYRSKNIEAKRMLDKAAKMLKPYPESINYPNYYYNEALYYTGIDKYDEALKSLSKGIPLSKKYNQLMLWQTLLFRKYEVYLRLKQYKQAKEVLINLLNEGPLKSDINNRKTIYAALAKTNALLGSMDEAYKWSGALNKLSDSINESKLKENVNALEIKFRSAENQKKIIELNALNQKANFSARNSRLVSWLLGLASLFLLIVAASGIFFYRGNKKLVAQKELNFKQELKDINQQQQIKIAQAMLQGQEEERDRVARDLHDGLGGMLAGVKINLSDFALHNNENYNVELNHIINGLDHSVSELRRIAHNMMPEMLLKFGLKTSLTELCESMASVNLRISFQCLSMKETILMAEQLTIYRIIQELLTNVVKHAEAKNVLLQCSQNKEILFITIEDDGKGFDPTLLPQKQGAGIRNIRNRIEYLRGKIEILSNNNNQGTTINIELHVTR